MGVSAKPLSCGEAAMLKAPHASLSFLCTITLMCCLSDSKQAEVDFIYAALKGSEKHFTPHTWPRQIAIHPVRRSVSFYDLPRYSYSHDKPVYQKGFLPAWSLMILRGEHFDLFAVMHSFLRHLPLAKKPNCGSPSSAGDPIEAVIPCRLKHILYFSVWQRWNWANLAWNASAHSRESPFKMRKNLT